MAKKIDYRLTIERNPKDGLYTIVCEVLQGDKVKETLRCDPASQKFTFANFMLLGKGLLDKQSMPRVLQHLRFR